LLDGGFAASDMIVGTEYPQLVSGNIVREGDYTCSPAPGCRASGGPFNGFCYESCRMYSTWALHFVSLYTTANTTTLPFGSDAQPAVASDGRDALVAWFSGPQASGGDVVAARVAASALASFPAEAARPQRLGAFASDSGPTRPDIATDGQRYVVVWRTRTAAGDHDVAGASIDHSGAITPLAIASSSADERDPSVIALGNGTFLVAYDKYVDGQRFIAGRFVTFGVHRRSVN
jgi:hypothetical protein